MSKLSLILYYVKLNMTQLCQGILDKFLSIDFRGKFKSLMADHFYVSSTI